MLIPYLIAFYFALVISLTYDLRKLKLKTDAFFILITIFFVILTTSLREIFPYSDSGVYSYNFQHITGIFDTSEFVFNTFMVVTKSLTDNFRFFLFIIALIYYLCLIYTCKNYSEVYQINHFLSVFFFLSMFFNYNLTMNILRQGLSIAFLLVILGLIYKQNYSRKSVDKIYIILLILLAFFSHHSSIIFILVTGLVIIFRVLNLRFYYIVYVFAIIISYFNSDDMLGIANILSSFGGENNYSRYGGLQAEYVTGFRLDFIVFNTVCLMLAIKIYLEKFYNDYNYQVLLKSYMMFSSIFFIFTVIPYSDRIGLYSWILIPFLLMPYLSYMYQFPKIIIVLSLAICYFFLNHTY